MSAELTTYKFVEKFGRHPGGRYKKDGAHSGEKFLEEVLLPAEAANRKTLLDLAGVSGFATSFLDGSFGEFAARFGIPRFDELFQIETGDDATLMDDIREAMENGAVPPKRSR